MNAASDRSIICPVMVGRDLPAQALIRLFERAQAGQGQIALITGEAGIGKSRLVRELRAQPALSATLILQGNCFEADESLPYAPMTDLLRTLFAALPPVDKQLAVNQSGHELVRLLPELPQEFPELSIADARSEPEKRRLHEALMQLFVRLSAATPLLIIIEDVHWCDDASLEFLLFLSRYLSEQRILVLLTYRDEQVQGALAGCLYQLNRERLTTEFRLPRLTLETVSTMVRAIFTMERSPREDFVNAIHSLSEGNPFFIEEMLKSLVVEGDIFLSDGKWERRGLDKLHIPRTIQVSLSQRLSRLSPAARDLLSMAAVAGRRFDFALLQHLTGSIESELLQLIRELKDAQFVVEESADFFAFRHALTRQAVYQELFARERRTLHAQIAAAIEQLYGGGSHSKMVLPDLAYHTYQAEQWAKAAQYGEAAGQYADTMYAPRAALEHYGRAIGAFDHQQLVPPLFLLRARGKAREVTGDFPGAQADYEAGLAVARETGNRHGEWQSLLDLGFLFTGLDFARAGRYLHAAIEAARELNDANVLAESLNRLGNWYMNQDLPLDALPYHREALTIFEQTGDKTGQAATLDLLGVTGVVGGDMVNSSIYYDQAIRLFRELDNRMGLSSALAVTCNRGGNCMEETVYCPPTGLAFLLNTADEARQLARAIGWQHGEAAADMYAGYGLILQGAYEQCLICIRRGIETASAASHTLYQAALAMAQGRLYNDLFAFEAALALLEPALQTARDISAKFLESSIGGFLVSAWIGRGEFTQAAALIQACRTEQSQSVGQRIIRCAEAELMLAQDDADRALMIIQQLMDTAPGVAGRVIPRLWQMKAEALLMAGKPDHSRVLLQEAADAANEGNLKSLLWRIWISQGKVELVDGKRTEAGDYFASARHLIETLAQPLSDGALREQFLAGAFGTIPDMPPLTARQSARLTYDGLTEREREIAILIASGKSSREIAEQLILSKRTVDAHTANILTKLNFSSRVQIARWVVEKKLL